MTVRAERLRDAITRRPRVTAVALVAVSALVLLARLGDPDRIMFDETYYVEDALGLLDTGVEPTFAVHPPLGKWLIAAGIVVVGDRPLGWRIAGALAGVLAVLLTHLLARRLLHGTRWGPLLAVLAPLLLLTDGLFVTQARISMLDIFLVLFTVAALHLLVVDRDRRRATLQPNGQPSLRWGVGVLLGLACAVKWSGLMAVGAAGLLTIAWEVAAWWRERRAGVAGDADGLATARPRSLPRRGVAVLGSLVGIPLVVYALTWLPWLGAYEHTWASGCDPEVVHDPAACRAAAADAGVLERVDGLLRYHEAGLDFHLGLDSTHDYRGDPLGWVVLQRPVVYYWEACSQDRADGVPTEDEDGELVTPEPCRVEVGDASEVMALGNPALWWSHLAMLPLLVAGVVRQDRRSAVPLVTWLSLWVPWLFVSRIGFLFYMAPAVPFLAIGVAVALARLDLRERLWRGHALATLLGAVGIVVGAIGQQLGQVPGGWRDRLLFMAVGAGLGALAGAYADRARDRRDPPGSSPFARPPTSDPDRHRHDRGPSSDAGDARGPMEVAHPAPAAGTSATGTAPRPTTGTVTVLAADGRRDEVALPEGGPTVDDGTDLPPDGPAQALRPAWVVPTLALVLVVVAVGLFTYFGPVWYGVPLDRDVLGWRWWFSSWV